MTDPSDLNQILRDLIVKSREDFISMAKRNTSLANHAGGLMGMLALAQDLACCSVKLAAMVLGDMHALDRGVRPPDSASDDDCAAAAIHAWVLAADSSDDGSFGHAVDQVVTVQKRFRAATGREMKVPKIYQEMIQAGLAAERRDSDSCA
jgi:hypothetical protein